MIDLFVGKKCVYPGHGVVEIVGEETKELSGHTLSVLVLKKEEMTIIVPKQKADTVGVRPLVSKEDIEEILTLLADHSVTPSKQTWNRRQREYIEKINTGCLFEVAEVIRDLELKRIEKPLSYGERQLLEQASSMLVSELAEASETSEQSVEEKISNLFVTAAAA